MSKLIEDITREIRSQFEAADHFKNLWMSTNEELERVKTAAGVAAADATREIDRLKAKLEISRLRERGTVPPQPTTVFVVGKEWQEHVTIQEDIHHHEGKITVYLKHL